jgi:general stress protein 26
MDTIRQFYLKSAREIMISSKKCGLITMDENGVPHVRTMDPFKPEDDFTVWLATHPGTRKVQQLKNNPNVVLYYADKNDQGYVTIHGKAELVTDQTEKDKRWKSVWKDFYPDRNENYLLIKIVPQYLEIINYNRGIFGDAKTWQPVRVEFN